VDDERNLLYMLTKNSNVEMVSLGDNGKGFNRITRLNSLRTKAATMAGLLAPGTFQDPGSFKIVSIQPISLSESQWWSLVAITTNGTRLYFSAMKRPAFGYGNQALQPAGQAKQYQFDLMHVRLPSQQDRVDGVDAGHANIHTAMYSKGLLLAANAVSEDVDVIQGASSDFHSPDRPPRLGLVEVTGSAWIDAKTWSIAPIPPTVPDFSNSELANQCLRPQRSFLVLTNIGISVLNIQRPVEILATLLQDSNAPAIARFFDHFGRDQSAAMCLAIASSQTNLTSSPVLRNALYVYLERGGEPVADVSSAMYTSTADELGRALTTPSIRYSGKLNGLALLFGRIVRPLWKLRLVRPPGLGSKYEANISLEILQSVKRPLAALDSLRAYMPAEMAVAPTEVVSSNQAVQSERQLMYDLWQLIGQTLEAVEFLDVMLREFNFVDILPTFTEAAQQQLQSMDFEGLTVTMVGRKSAKDIVMAIVNKFIGDQVSVDVMSNVLQQRCPSFVSGDDISVFKGMESLKRAHLQAGQSRDNLVKQSVQAFGKVAGHISPERLQEITQAYEQIHNYSAPVSLALMCAQAADPNKMALSWMEAGEPADGRAQAYQNRKKYYDVALSALSRAFSRELDSVKVDALKAAFESDDFVFLYSMLYDWLISNHYTDKLLDVSLLHCLLMSLRDMLRIWRGTSHKNPTFSA
jgi:nuclear pore complex protein Nup155